MHRSWCNYIVMQRFKILCWINYLTIFSQNVIISCCKDLRFYAELIMLTLITQNFLKNYLFSHGQEIEALQKFRRDNVLKQKSFITKLMLYSILLYIVTAIVFYFYFFPNNWTDRLLYSSPLLIFPVLWVLTSELVHVVCNKNFT